MEPPALQDNVVAEIFVKAVLDGTAAPFSTPCFISKAMVVLLWDMFCGSRGALVQYGIYGFYRFLATLSLGKYIVGDSLKTRVRRLRVAIDRPVRKPGGINQRLRENYKRRDKYPELAGLDAAAAWRHVLIAWDLDEFKYPFEDDLRVASGGGGGGGGGSSTTESQTTDSDQPLQLDIRTRTFEAQMLLIAVVSRRKLQRCIQLSQFDHDLPRAERGDAVGAATTNRRARAACPSANRGTWRLHQRARPSSWP